MANPLKVLTQLSASKEAQFAEVVEMQKTVTVSGEGAHLKVTGGGEISGSGAFKAAGAAQLGSSIDVKGAAALSGSLGVVGAASLQNTLGVTGIATFSSDLSASAGMDIGGALHVVGAADLDNTLNVDGAATFQSSMSGASTLHIGGASTLNGNVQMNGQLDVDGAVDIDNTINVQNNATFQASASVGGDLTVTANASVGGNLVVVGDLFVQGNTTSLATADLYVEDKLVVIASSSSPTDEATANNAGIQVMGGAGGNKEFKWVHATDSWTSNKNMDVASGKHYKIDADKVLAENATGDAFVFSKGDGTAFVAVSSSAVAIKGDVALADDLDVAGYVKAVGEISGSGALNIAGAADLNGALDVQGAANFQSNIDAAGYIKAVGEISGSAALNIGGVAKFASDVTASAGMDIAGALHIVGAADMDSTLNVDGQADFQAAANFHNDVAMDAALKISGSTFINITTPINSGKYNVNDAIRALDARVGTQGADINNNYKNLRFLETKNFDANGMAYFTSSFSASAIEQITVDVLVQPNGTSYWANDLLSVQVKSNGTEVCFEVSAPAMAAQDKVRLIAVKESGSLA